VVPKLLIENLRVGKHKLEITNLNLTDTRVAVTTKISSVVLLQYKTHISLLAPKIIDEIIIILISFTTDLARFLRFKVIRGKGME